MNDNKLRAEETNQAREERLRQKLTEYEARLIEIAELVANVRHEINNPLTGLIGQAQLLLREDMEDKMRKRVQTIEELGLRIRDIVARLREVQRPNIIDGTSKEGRADVPRY